MCIELVVDYLMKISHNSGTKFDLLRKEAKLCLFSFVFVTNLIKISSMLEICLKNLVKRIFRDEDHMRYPSFEFLDRYGFQCSTCNGKSLCMSCGINCHKGHELIPTEIKTFDCDCNSDKCSFFEDSKNGDTAKFGDQSEILRNHQRYIKLPDPILYKPEIVDCDQSELRLEHIILHKDRMKYQASYKFQENHGEIKCSDPNHMFS